MSRQHPSHPEQQASKNARCRARRTQYAVQALLALGLLSACGLPASSADDPAPLDGDHQPLPGGGGLGETLLSLSDGAVLGRTTFGTRSFIGIPYAAPPVGELRWKPPQPVQPWSTPLDATGQGVSCIQPSDPLQAVSQTEDCLRLNVFGPAEAPTQLVPVLVWLHGGGNTSGSANALIARQSFLGATPPPARMYDGAALRDFAERDVLVVTVNYRLGTLGFLSHAGLSQEAGTSGNYGLMDQQAALRWVQRNIQAFGGDPDRITLFGQAAGAIDGCYQMVAPGSRGLFQAAVLQSGTCGSIDLPDLASAERAGARVTAGHGCNQTDAAQVIACMRAKPAEQLAQPALPNEASGAPLATSIRRELTALAVIDGEFLTEQPASALAAGRYEQVPLIVGNTARDGSAILSGDRALRDHDQYPGTLVDLFGPDRLEAVQQRYPLSAYATPNGAAIAVLTDSMFACPARRMAARASQLAPAFLYSFERSVALDAFADLGAGQGVDLLWVWNMWPALNPYASEEVGRSLRIRSYWLQVIDGDVNTEATPRWSRPNWPRFESSNEPELVIDAELGSAEGRRKASCEFWDELMPL